MKFKQKFSAIMHDTDVNGIIYPSRLLMFMQETAHGHTSSLDCAPDVMFKRDGCCFWLTRLSMDILADIHAYEELEVTTYASNDSRGFSFNRCFEIRRDGILVARAYTVWALMNISSMRPVAVKDFNIDFELEEPIAVSSPIHVRIPRDTQFEECGKHTVFFRDVDLNGHMNNTRYPDVLCGFVPCRELSGKRISHMSISFLHEAAQGETVTGYCSKSEDGVFLIRTVRGSDSAVNAEAMIRFSELT